MTIYGAGFGQQQGSNTALLNNVAMPVTSWSPYSVNATVPAGTCGGPLSLTVNGTPTNTGNLNVVVMPPDGAAIPYGVAQQLNAVTPCGVMLQGGYWQVTSGTGYAILANPDLSNASNTSYNVSPVIIGWGPGTVTLTYFAADGTAVNSAIEVMGISSASVSGSQITIVGAGFGSAQGNGYVVLNNLYGLVTSWSDTQIIATMQPGTLSGNLYVHQGGIDSNSVFFSSAWAPLVPAITSLSPTSGIFGDSITINGAHFGSRQNGGSVTFNAVQATVSSWSDNAITVQVPRGASTGNVVVTANGATSNGSQFTVVTPMVTGLSPSSGQIGTTVTVSGSGFGQYAGSSFVSFNGTTATAISWSDTSVVVTVPSGATTGNVVLYRSGAPVYRGNPSTTATSNAVPFTVSLPTPIISSLSPASGLPGKTVIIAGSNFGWDQTVATVTFNGVAGAPTSWSPTAILIAVPTGATSGNVVVTVNGVPSAGVNFAVPTLTSIQLIPASPSIAVGSLQKFTVVGSYSDGSTQNLSSATWSSSASSVASVDSAGNATAMAQGQTTIQATVGGVSGSATLTVAPAVGSFTPTGNLVTARAGHSSTLLNNGQVLIAGGEDSTSKNLNSAELYDPATSAFAATGNLNLARRGHTASLLNNGMVLVAGGLDLNNVPMASAELYDPSTGTFLTTGSLNTPRQYATATVLSDGRVLIVGGQNSLGVVASAEIYDPATGSFTATGSLNTERVYHTASPLNDGTVLIIGGQSNTATALASAEIFNPVTGLFAATTGNPNDARQSHTATLLNNGTVLISQGFDNNSNVLGSAELYNPVNGTFSYTGAPNTVRNGSTATLLNNGTVLVTEGYDSSLTGLLSAEAYDPIAASFATIGNVVTARKFHTATLLNSGNVLITGGFDNSFNAVKGAELYQPATLTVPSLVSIAITPNVSSVSLGTAQRFTATGTFSDGSTQTLVSVAWSSSSTGVVTVTNDSTNSGAVYSVSAGSATISACAGSICGTTSITVPASQLVSLSISPTNATLTTGSSLAFYATGTYSNGSTQDLTAFVAWSSSAPSIASINGIGVASGLSTGLASINATYGSTSASVNLSVAPPVSSISVTPKNLSLAIGATQQLAATATYTDGTSGDVTNTAQWGSQAQQVATVSAGGSLTAVGSGTTVISAKLNGIIGSTNLTVSLPTMTITGVSPQSGSAGTQVTINGSGFGNTQGQGTVWLGTKPGIVVGWSDTQIIATVALGSSSGNAQVQQSGTSSNSVPFTVIGPTITNFSPSAGAVGTQVTINGSGFGATQGSGQVYLGTAAGIVSSWSDTQVVATVAPGATSGPVQILQNGVFSNQFAFTVLGTPPQISGITPNSGPIGTVVSISGSGFGASEGNGYVSIGGAAATVLQWSDTLVVASVGNGAVSGVVKVQQNGVWSNGKAFTVTFIRSSLPTMNIVPTSVSMVVGDSRTLQAVDSSGNTLTGLAWSSSDTTVISLSTDDPPILTALQPGTVTITAGAASADVTVSSGPTLPLGSTIWSNPGDGSGVSGIMPAVPSSKGVADVFAINNSGNIQAVKSDGTVAWTANVPVNNNPYFAPDFQGGLITFDTSQQSVYKLDGITGQPYPAYAPANHSLGYPAIHTDGTVMLVDSAYDPNSGQTTQASVTGFDPVAAQQKFQASAATSTSLTSVSGNICKLAYPQQNPQSYPVIPRDPIIAGDGFAYLPYFVNHSDVQVQDAAIQAHPQASYRLFQQLGTDLDKQSLNNNASTAGAVLSDVTALAQSEKAPPIDTTMPVTVWDEIAQSSQAGKVSQALTFYTSLAHSFAPLCNNTTNATTELHVMKVGSNGSSTDTLIQQWQSSTSITYGRDPYNPWSYTQTQSGTIPAIPYTNLITNADQGAVMAWGATYLSYCAAGNELGCNSNVDQKQEYHLASIPGGDVIMPEIVPNPNPAYYQWGLPLQPVLQLQDGTYAGNDVYGANYMARFDANGNVLNTQSGAYSPSITTADGGFFATSSAGSTTSFDASLNATGQLAQLSTQSWLGYSYELGSVTQSSLTPIDTADNFWDVAAGNPSKKLSADPVTHVALSVFNLYRTVPQDLQSNSTITTMVNNTRNYWSTKTKGRLLLDWDGAIKAAQTCDPVAYPGGCGAFPQKELDEITSVVGAKELVRRFCNPSVSPKCQAAGVQLVFTLNIQVPGPAQGYTPYLGSTSSPTFMNITAISATALEDAATDDSSNHDLSHELGHIFQLRHIGWSLPSNLMCTGILPGPLAGFNLCHSHAGGRLGTDQIQDSERGARKLQ